MCSGAPEATGRPRPAPLGRMAELGEVPAHRWAIYVSKGGGEFLQIGRRWLPVRFSDERESDSRVGLVCCWSKAPYPDYAPAGVARRSVRRLGLRRVMGRRHSLRTFPE